MSPRFARNGVTNPFGRMGDPINGIRLAEQTEAIVRRRAEEAGIPLREFIRKRLEIDFHGREEVERALKINLDLVAGKVHER